MQRGPRLRLAQEPTVQGARHTKGAAVERRTGLWGVPTVTGAAVERREEDAVSRGELPGDCVLERREEDAGPQVTPRRAPGGAGLRGDGAWGAPVVMVRAD